MNKDIKTFERKKSHLMPYDFWGHVLACSTGGVGPRFSGNMFSEAEIDHLNYAIIKKRFKTFIIRSLPLYIHRFEWLNFLVLDPGRRFRARVGIGEQGGPERQKIVLRSRSEAPAAANTKTNRLQAHTPLPYINMIGPKNTFMD